MSQGERLESPAYCENCDEYHVYKSSLCWKCYTESKEDAAIAKQEDKELSALYENAGR